MSKNQISYVELTLNNIMVPLMDAPEGVTAKTVIDRYIKAIGGRKSLENVKDISEVMSTNINGTELNITTKKKSPDKYMMVIDVPAMNQVFLKYVVNGDNVSVIARGQKQELSDEQKESIKKSTSIFPELLYETSNYTTKLLGLKNVNGEQLNVLQITTSDGQFIKEYFSADTGLRVKKEVSINGNISKTSYSDYQNVNGIMLPFKQTSDSFGQDTELHLKEAKINSNIEDSEFK